MWSLFQVRNTLLGFAIKDVCKMTYFGPLSSLHLALSFSFLLRWHSHIDGVRRPRPGWPVDLAQLTVLLGGVLWYCHLWLFASGMTIYLPVCMESLLPLLSLSSLFVLCPFVVLCLSSPCPAWITALLGWQCGLPLRWALHITSVLIWKWRNSLKLYQNFVHRFCA